MTIEEMIARSELREAKRRENIEWLLPKSDPKSPNDYKMSQRQEDALIHMKNLEAAMKVDFGVISIGVSHNQFYQRLERRGLVENVESYELGRKHCMRWILTSAGRATAINLDDLPF
jgi:hypothetical protein